MTIHNLRAKTLEAAKEVARCIGVTKILFIADSFKNFAEGFKGGQRRAWSRINSR